MLRSMFCVVFVVSGLLGGVAAKHFRGGYISWAPTGREREVTLFFRLAYKHGFFSDPDTVEVGEDCTALAIQEGTPIPTGGTFDCIPISDGVEVTQERADLFDGSPPYYTCTNIRDTGDDEGLYWSSGYNKTNITLPEHEDNIWTVGYDSCCWLNTLENYVSPRSWRLRTTIDLSPRADLNGLPNSSPYIEGLPMKTVAQGCLTSIPINAIDPDGDKMKCRWTQSAKDECEANCGNPDEDIFEMSERNCKIKVNADNAEPGLYAVAVIIEDFPRSRRRRGPPPEPFSKVAYQFLVSIIQRDVDCNRVVTEIPEKSCYAVPSVIDPPFSITLRAETTNSTIPIVSIDMITQPGMEISELVSDGNGRYHVDVTWIPPADKRGTVEQLCYQAVDQESIAGQELCVKLFIGGTVPEPMPLISTPSSNESVLVNYDNQLWHLYFTERVELNRDQNDAKVAFLFENGTMAHEVTINQDTVVNTSMVEPYFISFETPDFNLKPNTTYTIKLRNGAVVGTEGCHLPSEQDEWQFTTEIYHRALPKDFTLRFQDGVSVECKPTFMIAYVERELLPDIEPSMLSYDDPECYGIQHNDTHIAIGTMYGKCGTEAIVNEDETRVSMINNLYFPQAGSFVFGNVSTRSENVRMRVNCSIPTRRVAYVEFNTNSSVWTFRKDATGDYDFSLKMFPDENYRKPYRVWDFPVDVQANARLYFEARTFSAGLAPFLEECVATPTADPSDSLRYTLIKDGCRKDDTIMFHDASSSRFRFSVEAFSFIGYNLQSSIFVHCDLRECNPRNGSCDTNCPESEADPNRSRRDISSLRVGAGDELTDGPIRIIPTRGHGDAITLAEIILICLVSLVIVMIMLLGYLVVRGMTQANRSMVCPNCSEKSKMSKLALISSKTKI